jgi:hypothetical protein
MLRRSPGAAAVLRLHRRLALFIADNLRHMELEETAHNQALWQTHTDDEIRAVEQALVASLPAQELMFVLEWMTLALPPAERAAQYRGLQARMPPEPFRQMLAMARRVLDARDWHKLAGALGVPT